MLLDELVARLGQLPEKSRTEAIDLATKSTATMAWVPNPGPQTEAFVCEADELFYGGEAGGGKTDLGIGLALTEHKRSLLLRRINKDAVKIKPRIEEILGQDNGYNGQLQRWRLGERQIDIAGCEQESDKQRFKGDPHDLIVFDEGTDFLESQYRFIIGWNRSTDPKQRCRVIVASNPPTTPEGLWVVKYWGPWLDTTHPDPAKPGELRWFTTVGGEDCEVDGPGPHLIDGEPVYARSRTFIRATLSDNPDLARTGYASVRPQTEAFVCEADELFYGGEAGGGKTDLGIGLALTEHKRSLLLRRINKDCSMGQLNFLCSAILSTAEKRTAFERPHRDEAKCHYATSGAPLRARLGSGPRIHARSFVVSVARHNKIESQGGRALWLFQAP